MSAGKKLMHSRFGPAMVHFALDLCDLLAEDRGGHREGGALRPAAHVHGMQEVRDTLVECSRVFQIYRVTGVQHHYQG